MQMDGGIVNPGDLHGRVLPASQVDLCWDGNQIGTLVGPGLVHGVSGFGDTCLTLCGNSLTNWYGTHVPIMHLCTVSAASGAAQHVLIPRPP